MSARDTNSHDTSSQAQPEATIRAVYKQVWKEYYEWETASTRTKLLLNANETEEKKAKRPSTLCLHATMRPSSDSSSWPLPDDIANNGCTVDDTESFTLYQLPDDGDQAFEEVIVGAELLTLPEFAPCPAYEACTPMSTNILQGDDPDDMPFIPFADDPEFDAAEHCKEYDRFAWQVNNVDPDLNAILLETAVRLHYVYNLPIAHIDEAAVLPKALNNYNGTCGVIWISTQNDIVDWPGSSRSKYPPLLPRLSAPDAGDLRSRLQDNMTIICPKSTCNQALCFTHNFRPALWALDDDRFRLGASDAKEPTVGKQPCSDLCYLLRAEETPDSESDVSWSASDRAELRVLLQAVYGLPPCDVAALCRKPCRDMPFMRKLLDSKAGQDIARPNTRANSISLAHKMEFADTVTAEFTPNDPCDHDGPCTADKQCACTLNKTYCTQSCRCGFQCSRRWWGCDCGHKSSRGKRPAGCTTAACPCRSANRECDPELCAPCFAPGHASGSDDTRRARGRPPRSAKGVKHTCRNCQVQMGYQKELEVKKSGFGMGVFLTEPAREGDLIAEYTGELIFEPTFLTRGALERHRGRNYVYGLNQSFSVDGTYVGNETRFINHAPKQKANGKVTIPLVNGDHRIGVFARKAIPAGSELFIDYGPEFGL